LRLAGGERAVHRLAERVTRAVGRGQPAGPNGSVGRGHPRQIGSPRPALLAGHGQPGEGGQGGHRQSGAGVGDHPPVEPPRRDPAPGGSVGHAPAWPRPGPPAAGPPPRPPAAGSAPRRGPPAPRPASAPAGSGGTGPRTPAPSPVAPPAPPGWSCSPPPRSRTP